MNKMSALYLNFSDDYFIKYKHLYFVDFENFIMRCYIKTYDHITYSRNTISELFFDDFKISTEQEFLKMFGELNV